ncbi:hypothetical protein [Prauserella flavalba]|uniref:hypothetical protein n=1 Tax=Prauserella flavalba TaxID=1477506 RepID=UPI0036EDF437
MDQFVLLITDHTSLRSEITCHTRGISLVTRTPEHLARADWDAAALVLIDMQAAPILRTRPHPLPHRDAVTMLAAAEDRAEPDLYRHAVALGASHVITLPDGAGALRKQIAMLVASLPMVVAVLDPATDGEVGAVTAANLALAGVAAGHHVGLIHARASSVDVNHALQAAELNPPAVGRGTLHALYADRKQAPPRQALQQAMSDMAARRSVTVAHLDPHRPDTWAVLYGIDLVIVPVPAPLVTDQATRDVVTAARGYTPHVHVHVTGTDLDTDVTTAVAASMGADYPSMTGIAITGSPASADQLSDHGHRAHLWAAVARHRPTAETTT